MMDGMDLATEGCESKENDTALKALFGVCLIIVCLGAASGLAVGLFRLFAGIW